MLDARDWNEGYVSDISYTAGFYQAQSPENLNYCCLLNNYEPLDLKKGFNYCDLGCGHGFTVNMLSAIHPEGNFYGIDFNPEHIRNARNLALRAGLNNAHFWEQSFQEIVDRQNAKLPNMDVVILHGIYSWVNRKNQEAIIEFLKGYLNPGGIVYISYNSQPGRTIDIPMQSSRTETSAGCAAGNLNPARTTRTKRQ